MSVRATLPNPFRQRTIADLWQMPELDSSTLHQVPYESCCDTFQQLRAEGQSGSLLLYGEPGNGKSHLLARMISSFSQANHSNDFLTAKGWTFISVNLQYAQKMTWQHLQTCLATDLLRETPSGLTQLERLLLCRLTHYGVVEGDGRVWLERLRKDARSVTAFTSYLEDVFEALDPGELIEGELRKVLRYLLLGFNQQQAGTWLRGEPLPPPILEQLGLGRLPTDEAELEAQARRIVLGLCLLVTPQMPFIFCFDQVEALQQDAADAQGLASFLDIFRTLRKEARCALLIASTQSLYRDPLRRALRELEAEQQAELTEIWLAPLTWREAQQLINLRLDSVPALARMRGEREHDRFWPLDESDILTAIGFQARQLFVHCAMLYEQSRPTGSSGALHSGKLHSGRLNSGRLNSGRLHSGSLNPTEHAQFKKLWLERFETFLPDMKEDDRFDERLTRGLSTLVSFARPSWKIRTEELPRNIDLLFEGPEHSVQMMLCNHTHLPSYTKKVQRMLERFYGHRTYVLLLLRDTRRAFGPMSRTPRKLREEIIDRGGVWVDVTPEMQAAVETLHALFTDSEAGDQGCRGVCEWAVETPVPELKLWLEKIFPEDPLEVTQYTTGRLA
jgi:hypothetical protein